MNCKVTEEFGVPGLLKEPYAYDPEIYSRPNVVFLGVTARCNLSCPYCFVHQSNSDMSMETAENAIKIAFENTPENGKPLIIFFGGEPLIRFDDLVKPLVEKYYGKADFSITTNGTLLTEDVVDFLFTHQIEPLLSFDGVPEVQNFQRPGKGFTSFDAVYKNVPYLLVRFPNVTVRGTLTKKAIPHLKESFLMFEEMGFKNITFGVDCFEEWTEEDGCALHDQFEQLGVYIWKRLNTPTRYPVPKFGNLITKVQAFTRGNLKEAVFDNSLIRCGTGTTTFSVCPNGDIVPCQEKISNPTWIIGNVNTVEHGIDPEKHKAFLDWYQEKINSFSCGQNHSKSMSTCLMCLQEICPSRCEDVGFVKRSSECYYNVAIQLTAARFYSLTAGTIRPDIAAYFEEVKH